ncbi:hypothetical protein J4N45_10400 [Vibrio sp. SCSIO 43140]|uniref:hypothetical protein n=1 Tax=Vibrio sp. SCSIO 43140 TaxID=2819100 RepID=UPI002074CA45|nr:hypothetical protein [Vibrio sp. SCSIO 43140]USD58940.1 hypothetical protein J4N45_10400 [Vibrio sp. SCSIO 43140]
MSHSIQSKLTELGMDSEHLDAVVDHAAQIQVSRINNEGMEAQLRYLEQQGYSENEILAVIASVEAAQ